MQHIEMSRCHASILTVYDVKRFWLCSRFSGGCIVFQGLRCQNRSHDRLLGLTFRGADIAPSCTRDPEGTLCGEDVLVAGSTQGRESGHRLQRSEVRLMLNGPCLQITQLQTMGLLPSWARTGRTNTLTIRRCVLFVWASTSERRSEFAALHTIPMQLASNGRYSVSTDRRH